MARRRYLSTQISVDKSINQLAIQGGDFAVMLYTWMIPHAGDDGRLTADPDEILMTVIPGRRDKTPDDVQLALECMGSLGLIEWDGAYIAFPAESFYRYQGIDDMLLMRQEWAAMRRNVAPLVFQRDGYQCRQCFSAERLTVDHITAIANGGTNEPDNLQTLCQSCNSRKGAR